MTTWREFEAGAPELAAAVRARLEAMKHHVLATLRRDGSPRVSGTEVAFRDEALTIGSMWQAVKVKDLQRDPRYALHANPGDGSMAGGDAKLSGWVREIPPPADFGEPAHFFELLLEEVVRTSLHPDGDRLVIQTWRPDTGLRSVDRY
jgi:hypothetical protein